MGRNFLSIYGIRVRFKHLISPVYPTLQIGGGLTVHRKNTVLSSSLNGHVANGKAVIHLQRSHAVSNKL